MSQQSSAFSSAASSSLDIGWDVESRSSSRSSCSSSSSSCPDGYSPAPQHRLAALGCLGPPCSRSEPVRRHAIVPPTFDSTVAVAVARPSRSSSPISGRVGPSLPPALRQNRRRTIRPGPAVCPRPPPALVRQSDRKLSFVDSLVDAATQIVQAIWPLANVGCRNATAIGGRGVLPLKTFVQETLRRSRTSYSTLQVALFYLVSIKHRVPKFDFTMEQPDDTAAVRALQCGRRMLLAALILASKYLQDRNYSARAWSKISGLSTKEINVNEMAFLDVIDWRLHVPEAVFRRWTDFMLKHAAMPPPPRPCPARLLSVSEAAAAPSSALSSSCSPLPAAAAPAAAFALPTPPTSSTTSPTSSPPSSVSVVAKRDVDWSTVIGSLTPESVRRSPSPALVRA